MSDNILNVRGLTKRFGGVVAVDNVDLDVRRHSITALIGPNGAGKTTLFNLVSGLYEPTAGEVLFCACVDDRRECARLRPDRVAGLGIARTFQNIRLFGELSVLDNVRVGFHLRAHKSAESEAGLLGSVRTLGGETVATLCATRAHCREEDEVTRAALGCLDFVGILGEACTQASALAYGLQRRVEIARALAARPQLLLLDEPAAGMNPRETEELCVLIERIRSIGITVFLIEHDMSLVMKVSEAITVLDYGEVIARGRPDEIRGDARVIEAYLGREEDL